MRTGVIKASAALFALALLVGVFGLNTQPTQAVLEVDISENWASVPAARIFSVRAYEFVENVADTTLDVAQNNDDDRYKVVVASTRTIMTASGGSTTTLEDDDDTMPAIVTGYIAGPALDAALALPAGSARDAALLAQRPGILHNDLEGLPEDSYEGDWVEVLTGPAAGMARSDYRVRSSNGTLTFDTADGLHPTATIAAGGEYRIVEENPTRTVALEIFHDDTEGPNVVKDPLEIEIENSGVGEPKTFEYKWTAATAVGADGDPAIFKFDLVAQNRFTTRTVGVQATDGSTNTVVDTDRDERNDYWVGRTISVTSGGAFDATNVETRLIIGSTNVGTITVFPVFTNAVAANDGYRINIEEVPAYEDQTADFQYGIFRRVVTTDKIGPIISAVSPVKGAVVQDGEIVFQADIIDVSSGYSSDEDKMEDGGEIQRGWVALEVLSNIIPGDDPGVTWTKISDGWRLTYKNSFGRPGSTDPIPWRIVARDRAGAQTIQDHTSSSNQITVDGEDPVAIARATDERIPSGESLSADRLQSRTGDNWRASNKANERWRSGGSGSHAPPLRMKSENRRGVLVVFDEAGGLDVGSVDASDFSVDGQTPTAVTVVDVFEDSKSDPDSKKRRPQEVFLTMGSNLPSDGKDSEGNRLEVVVSGTIRDVAGNSASSETIALADGIPPRITVTIDDADEFDKDSVTVQVSVDETLIEAPTLTVRQSISTSLNSADENVSVESASPVMSNTASQAYEVDIEVGDSGTVPDPNQAALLNVVVNAKDVASNEEEVGDDDDWTQAGAFTFELDPELNNSMEPGITVAGKNIFDGKLLDAKGAVTGDDAEIDAVDPLLITIDFSRECDAELFSATEGGCQDGGEAKEYYGDTHKTVELSGLDVDVDLADGSGASPEFTVSSSDNITYTLAVSNPPVGVYTISLRAADEGGNVSLNPGAAIADTLESEFTVKAAVATELGLSPGWNLISLPFQPANPSINSVLPTTHPASLVMSYDNATGLWVVSRRDSETGMFVGDVRQMVATTAYFVFTDSLEPVKLIRSGLATAAAAPAVPSAIAVKAGWNLIPVLTYQTPLPGDPPGSGGVSADDYLGALRNAQGDAAWLRALLWDTSSQTWISVAPGDTVTLRVGDTNPCTDDDLDATSVESGVEPCQASQTDNFKDVDDNGSFDNNDTVVMERHLPLGAGMWLWSTIDSVVFPTA